METRNIQIPLNLIAELGVTQLIDITDRLPKNRIKNWDQLNAQRKPEALTDIAWHHSGEFVDDDVLPETHANNHIKNTGDHATGEGGFPYHFYIKNGAIFQGNNILTFTYGISSNNYQTVHCCVEGCYAPNKGRPADVLSDENRRAMIALELTLRGVLPNYQRTNGHNFYRNTLCPGYSMTRFREEVAAVESRLLDTQKQAEWEATNAARDELAYRIANVILWTRNTAQGIDQFGEPAVSKEDQEWAKQRLFLLEPVMREHGFIK